MPDDQCLCRMCGLANFSEEQLNGGKSICIDTGCSYGNKLTALEYPSLKVIDVPAREVYHEIPETDWWE